MKTITVKIGGMTCAACAAGLTRVFAKNEATQDVQVNYATETMRLVYDETVLNGDEIEKLVKSAGFFIVQPSQGEKREEQKKKEQVYFES